MITLRGIAGSALRALPEGLALRVVPGRLGYRAENIPAPLYIAPAHSRLLVAPANSAAQGHLWATAAGRLPGVNAVNLSVRRGDGYRFPSDFGVPSAVFAHSRRWSRTHLAALEESVSHILIESERGVLGAALDHDVRREGRWLDQHGIRRAYVSHGSDVRHPDLHSQTSPWSPFRDQDWEKRSALVALAERNTAFLREQTGHPLFVVTADLLLDLPDAVWLPNVVDTRTWANQRTALTGDTVRVLHAPTDPHIKGSDLVAPAVERLQSAGKIVYLRVRGAAFAQMPGTYADADVVLDQFRIGIYSTTALEAMASGRLVLGFLLPHVRALAERESQMDVPIVQATPDTIEDVLADVAARPDHYRPIAEAGPAFVRRLHSGAYSARVLADAFLTDGTR